MEQNRKYDDLILSELKYEPDMAPDFREIYRQFAERVLWIDGNLVPGAFQMNVSWYKQVPALDPIFAEHSHASAEIIGFFGSDPEDPHELHGEIRVVIDGEEHVLTRSSLIFFPPNLPHAIRILRVDRPIFHFSVVTESEYNGGAYAK
ncbi:MAG: hypothetical protein J5967_02860 [Oscillospiraceae bacterium]|nr:hypothetical protein [Oscillospiraceae bacterium]